MLQGCHASSSRTQCNGGHQEHSATVVGVMVAAVVVVTAVVVGDMVGAVVVIVMVAVLQ